MKRYKAARPKRADLSGLSPSEFKTLLRRAGHKVSRNFYSSACISYKGNCLYRWRWWSELAVVDVSCAKEDFDRWANSVESTIPIKEWIDNAKC